MTQIFTVAKSGQTIIFEPFTTKTYGDTDFTPVVTASSGLAVFYSSDSASIATIVNGKIHITGVGSTIIRANQAGNEFYNAASEMTQILTVAKSGQIITFGPFTTKTFGDTDFTPGATASSSLPVIYSSDNASVATIVNGKIHITGVGSTLIRANQAGNQFFNAASEVTQLITVAANGQTITFGPLEEKTYNDSDFVLHGVSSSGLTVVYSSSDTTIARISDSLVHITGAGVCTLTATQAGNKDYGAATPVNQALTVNKAEQIISFTTITNKYLTSNPFMMIASSSSGLPVIFISSNGNKVRISNDSAYIQDTGSVTITATQPGSLNYKATQTTKSFTVYSVATPLAVGGNRKNVSLVPVISWFAIPNANSFHIQVASDVAFTQLIKDTIVADTAVQLDSLSRNTSYYWRLATINGDDKSPFSTIDSFTTIPSVPTIPPVTIAVGENRKDTSLTPFLKWKNATAADSFRVQVARNTLFTDLITDTKIADTVLQLDSLTRKTTFYWHVSIINAGGESPFSTIDSFTIIPSAPVIPPVTIAVGDRKNISLTPQLRWNSYADADSFHVQVAKSNTFTDLITDTKVADTVLQLDSLARNTTFHWRVSIVNAGGESPFSITDSFITIPFAPSTAPKIKSIVPLTARVGTTIILSWDTIYSVNTYHIQLSTTPSFENYTIDSLVAGANDIHLADLKNDSTYYWRIAASNTGGDGVWSSVQQFTTLPNDTTNAAVITTIIADSVTQVTDKIAIKRLSNSGVSSPVITVSMKKDFLSASSGSEQISPIYDFTQSPLTVLENKINLSIKLPDSTATGSVFADSLINSVRAYTVNSTGSLSAIYDQTIDASSRTITIINVDTLKRIVLAIDTVTPTVIDSTPAALRTQSSVPNVKGLVKDNISNLRSYVYFRKGGESSFDSLSITTDVNGAFDLPITGTSLDANGFEYFIAAFDGASRKILPRTDIPVTVTAISDTMTFPSQRWKLFAAPLILSNDSVTHLLSGMGKYGTDWKLFIRSLVSVKDSFIEFGPSFTTIGTGKAYWLKTARKNFKFAIDTGITSPVSHPFEIVIPSKSWASIGDPYLFPVGWQSILDSSNVNNTSLIGPYSYQDSAWLPPTILDHIIPWQGYYVYNSSDSTIILKIPSLRYNKSESELSKMNIAAQKATTLEWIVKGANGCDYRNYFGFSANGSDGYDAGLDCPKPGLPENNGPVTWFESPVLSKIAERFQTNFTTLSNGGAVWNISVANLKVNNTYSCYVSGLNNLPDSISCILIDKHAGVIHKPQSGAYQFKALPDEDKREIELVAGTLSFIDAYNKKLSLPPAKLLLSNIYPNPVRSHAIIRYALPWSAEGMMVSIDVFDIQGRLISTLIRKRQKAGYYTINWNCTTAKGGKLSSGFYLLRIKADTQQKVVKLNVIGH